MSFNLGQILAHLTGGDAFGGGFMGDMRGIGHSMMEHYRDGSTGAAAKPTIAGFLPNPITAPAAQPGPTIVPPPAAPAMIPGATLAQIAALLHPGGGGNWGMK